MKKVLSLILAMAMVLSLAPQIFAADTGASAEPDITFIPLVGDPVEGEHYMKIEAEYETEGYNVKTGRVAFYFKTGVCLAKYTSFAIRINVPVTGKYAFSVNAAINTDQYRGYADVYMAKVDENTSYKDKGEELINFSNSNYKLGEYDGTGDSPVGLQDVEYTFEKGDYLVVFFPNEKNKDLSFYKTKGVRNFIASMTLTKIEDQLDFFGEENYETEADVVVAPQVNVLEYATDGSAIAPENIKATDNGNGTYSVTTDAEVNGYTFRYWAKGLESKERKRIVSFDANFTYTPSNEKNYLIAVYDKAGTEPATTEYYNANGQKLANGEELPYMAGYGQATGWKEPVYGIKEAIYGEPIKYEITIGDAEPVEYAWGEPVPCVAEEKAGQIFWGWKKTVNGENAGIVSTDPEYTFYAWEDCTVTPIYKETEPEFAGEERRIILGTFTLGDNTAVMAEFFGFDEAIERGVTIDGTDYAMTNKQAKQFTIVDDDSKGNISAYAILADRTKYIYNLIANTNDAE